MKIRVLVLQHAHPAMGRPGLASGREYELNDQWARELLAIGAAEPIGETPSKRAEKRPAGPTKRDAEKR